MTTQPLIERSRVPDTSDHAVPRVLIVDGDPAASPLLTEALRFSPSRLKPIVAESGEAALRVLRSDERVDFLLADLRLPEMDGLELLLLARQLRPGLKLAAMTDSPSEEARRAAFESGALRLLAKPLDAEDLAGLLSDRPGFVSLLEGDLDLADLCQLSALRLLTLRHLIEWAMRGRLSCDLTVTSENQTGVLSFEDGKIRSAATSDREGGLAAAEILTWENLRVTVTRSAPTGAAREAAGGNFVALIDRFRDDIPGFLGTGVVRRKDRSPVAGRADAPHLASGQTAAAFSRVVDRHLAALEILGGTEIWGDTEDILITTANAYLLLRMLGSGHYQWLAVSREANLGMCRLLMRSFETFFLGELASLGEIS